jgi:hypothetical protein
LGAGFGGVAFAAFDSLVSVLFAMIFTLKSLLKSRTALEILADYKTTQQLICIAQKAVFRPYIDFASKPEYF